MLITSCKEPLGIEKNVEKNILEKELFPLSAGNKWHYEEIFYDKEGNEELKREFILDVLSTHITKGKLWYQISKSTEPSIEHFYCHQDDGLWYRVPNYFPSEKFLILNYQTSDNDILTYKDIYRVSKSDYCDIEVKLVNTQEVVELNKVDFKCYKYNLYRKYKDNNLKYLFKEQYFAKGVGLIKEKEYDYLDQFHYIRAIRKLTIYKVD
jgi:uncharacterized protein YbaR (Trm112 family)